MPCMIVRQTRMIYYKKWDVYVMPVIVSVETAVPPHPLPQELAKAFAREHFSMSLRDATRLLPVFDHAGVSQRYLGAPLDWLQSPHGFAEKNERYQTVAAAIASEAATKALAQTPFAPTDIDAVLYVTSTGIATPSLDVKLITALGLRNDVSRLPIWGLGCAGGAAGLARAADWTRAHPDHVVLLVCVELCSLTFIGSDHSTRNLVGAALFGDGAAAAIVVGTDRAASAGLTIGADILGARSFLFSDSQDIMGWDVTDEGLAVVFSRDIPTLVEKEMAEQVDAMLALHGLDRRDLAHFIAHPGGAKVIAAYARALDCPIDWLRHAASVLSDYGNMSSPTVLFVLSRAIAERREHLAAPRQYGILAALGPGFSCEQVLLSM